MFEDLARHLTDLRRVDQALDAGDALFRAGDQVHVVYFVTGGAVQLVRHQPEGAPLVLQRAAPGSILAEASLYSAHYHCDAVATAATSTWSFRKSDLSAALNRSPEFAHAWAWRLALDVQKARFQAEVLSRKTVAARLSAWIEWNGKLPKRGEWKELAAEIAVSPEALYREMAKRAAPARRG